LCLLVCAFVLMAAGCGSKNSPASPVPGFTPSGPLTLLSAFATFGSNTYFSQPSKIQYVNGKLWITDVGNNTLQEWAPNGSTTLTTITTFHAGDTFSFSNSAGIGLNPTNNDIYVADYGNKRIVVFDSTGTYRTEFGNPQLSAAPAADFAKGVAVNSAGTTVYVAGDTGGIFGYAVTATTPLPAYSLAVSFGTSGSGALTNPTNLKLDSSGNVWVADFGHGRLVEFSPAGSYLNAVTLASPYPTDLAFDPSNNIYVTEIISNQIAVFDATATPVTTLGSAALSTPEGITTDKNGVFYVTNSGSADIVAFH
jgi:trimeric autotransporter adhesin